MKKFILTVVDTSGIQNYVFGTNSLQQNVGASYLVDCATRQWAVAAIPCSHNVLNLDDPKRPFDLNLQIEQGNVEAEVVYAGGGNVVILFSSMDHALQFTRNLSGKVLKEAPGLKIVVVHKEFDWDADALGGKTGIQQTAMRDLAKKKNAPPVSVIQPGLAVTASCVYTGMPAVGTLDGKLASAESIAKVKAEPEAIQRLLGFVDLKEYKTFPKNFEELGSTPGEKSYLAVAHIDGNGMGARVESIRDKPEHLTPAGNRHYVESQRAFSLSIQAAARIALQAVIDMMIRNVDKNTIGGVIDVSNQKLPFRPIVFGGDDTTFICDGRIGLSLARCYIETYEQQLLADQQPAYCRAGVSIVHSHFPFSRAYELAESLCASAKKFIQEQATPGQASFSAMDWHYATSGIVFDLKETRKREYTVAAGELTMRPVRVTPGGTTWRTWENFERAVTEFQSGAWAGKHNKVKALRTALRDGETAVANFLKLYPPGDLPGLTNWNGQNAWIDTRCGYFDAVEIEDFFIPLS